MNSSSNQSEPTEAIEKRSKETQGKYFKGIKELPSQNSDKTDCAAEVSQQHHIQLRKQTGGAGRHRATRKS